MIIRPVQPGDLPALRDLFLQSRQMFTQGVPTSPSLNDFDSQTAGEWQMVALEGDRLAGFISVWEPGDFIHHLYVLPQFGRRGVGQALLRALPSWPTRRYRLMCPSLNAAALAFCHANRFTRVGDRRADDQDYLLLESCGAADELATSSAARPTGTSINDQTSGRAGWPTSRRLTLRPLRASDAEALFKTMADPAIMQWWSRPPFETLADLRDDFTAKEQSNWRSWAIVKIGEDHALGFVAAGEKRKGVSEIGYLLAREAHGQGFAREAVSILVDQLFAEGQRRIFADTDPDNQPSVKLLEALGFAMEGRLRAEWHTHIGVRDSLIYGLLAEEWRSS